MGGGAAMRAAGKVAGIDVFNGVMRGGLFSATAAAPPASQSLRNVTRPAGGILSSGKISGGEVAEAEKATWVIDDWEFAGGESDFELAPTTPEPMARVVFGGSPSLEEAKEATSDLKDALDKVYFSSDKSSGNEYEDRGVAGREVSGLPLLPNSEYLENKSSITCNPKSASLPKPAIQAFKLLTENPSAQSVVASIASDPNVWNVVMQNDALMEFIKSQKANMNECVADEMFEDEGSPKKFVESSDLGKMEDSESRSGDTDSQLKPMAMAVLHEIKDSVVKMVSNVGNYLQNIFGMSAADKASAETDSKSNFFEKTLGASFVGLAMMVIMVVLLRRA